MSEVFLGISNYECNNSKLFNFVELASSKETLLQYRQRKESDGNLQMFIGIPIAIDSDGKVNSMSLMLGQELLANNEHFKASGVEAKVYILEDLKNN